MEAIFGSLEQKRMKQLGKASVKIASKLELKTAAKKILSTTANCFGVTVERVENEFRVSGRVVTRVVFIDEFDAFNSEERVDNFSEKITVKGFDVSGAVSAVAIVADVGCSDVVDITSTLDIDKVVEIRLTGLVASEVRFASGITGDAEVRGEKIAVATFADMIEDKITADERIELDKNCSGVLGVDFRAYIRDISCNDGRVTVKGSVSANVVSVRTTEFSTMQSSSHDFDFSKTINVAGVTMEDTVVGSVAVHNVIVKAENRGSPELVLEVDIAFSGAVVRTMQIEHAVDAFGFGHNLTLVGSEIENINCLPQTNAVVDIEGNVTVPANSVYISKVLATSATQVSAVNIVASDGKVTLEGMLGVSVVFECEEKQVHAHMVRMPFATSVKMDGMTTEFSIQAAVQVVSCYVKARRGKELLVDAKLGISVAGTSTSMMPVTGNILVGEAKVRDESAIMIYIVNANETLWDVAKRINVGTAEIIRQNPFCADGVQTGDKLFIYRQQVVSF